MVNSEEKRDHRRQRKKNKWRQDQSRQRKSKHPKAMKHSDKGLNLREESIKK
jgi:hypothetical protein